MAWMAWTGCCGNQPTKPIAGLFSFLSTHPPLSIYSSESESRIPQCPNAPATTRMHAIFRPFLALFMFIGSARFFYI